MPSGSTAPSVFFRHASAAAGVFALLAIVLTAAPALADPSLLTATPRLQAVDYVSKLPPGVSADSDRVYQANMHEPRTHTGAIHLHGGVWAPIDATVTNAMLGLRIGANLGEPVLLGVLTGWTYHTKSLYDTVASGPPGLSPRTVLATGKAHLIPAMAFLQVTLTQKLPIVPYAGIAAGYEWLHLAAKDYRTDADTSLTYANWAWEWYAGAGLKLSQSVRVDGEVYYNGAALVRDVAGANNRTFKESVDMNGAGARIGLNIVY
jgi:hypothetical protein